MSDETATAGEATTATAASYQNTVVADWRTEISEPGLRRVAEKFTSPAEVVKSYAALQSRLGRSVVKPGPDAAPEEIAAYRRQLGVPESAAGYEVRLPEDLPAPLRDDAAGAALQQDFLKAMHEGGAGRAEEHTSELQSLKRSSYAVLCLKKNNIIIGRHTALSPVHETL